MVDDPSGLKNSLAARPHLENRKGKNQPGGTFLLPKSSFSKRPMDLPPRSSPRWVNVPSAAAARETFREVDKNRGVFEKKNGAHVPKLHVYNLPTCI